MTIAIAYSVADNGTYDTRGRKQARVTESYEGIEGHETQTFIVPGLIVESFIRARRSITERILTERGYAKAKPPIDWSFLDKGTKQ